MRLTCPNCSARYEVDDEMIPPDGRDVQCSNCSTTWFQPGARSAAIAEEPEDHDVPEDAGDDTPAPDAAEVAEVAPPPPQPVQREIDPSVLDLLREEAEREERLRRGQPEAVETQQEMPLERQDTTPRRSYVDEAEDEDTTDFDDAINGAVAATMASGSRRDLLPDIEEINSTLRATSDRRADEDEASDIDTMDEAPRRRRGLRLGFLLTLIVALGLVLVYTNAPQIGTRVPDARPYLQSYVAQVDAARFWLDDLAQSALDGATIGGE